MTSLTGIRGLSEPTGSWKMICIRRRNRFRSLPSLAKMSSPSIVAEPAVCGCSRMTVRPSVDLPQPDSPTRPKTSPLLIENETSSTALTSPTLRRNTPAWIG